MRVEGGRRERKRGREGGREGGRERERVAVQLKDLPMPTKVSKVK